MTDKDISLTTNEKKVDLKADYTDKKTGLTEKEQYFLDILFDYHKGNVRKAMDAAGYPKDTPTSLLTSKLKDKIREQAEAYLAATTAKAVLSLDGVLDDPTAMGANTIIKAAKEVLDRTGVVAPEQKEKVIERNVFILPAKQNTSSDNQEEDLINGNG